MAVTFPHDYLGRERRIRIEPHLQSFWLPLVRRAARHGITEYGSLRSIAWIRSLILSMNDGAHWMTCPQT
jgi:hypothetical protein